MSHNNSLESKFASIKPIVEFEDIGLVYPLNENFVCKYYLRDYISREGDRIAIYKLGWVSIKEYEVFEWAPINNKPVNTVTFSRHVLPKNTVEMYQICYVNSENQTCGVSMPFQFTRTLSANVLNKSTGSDNLSFESLEIINSDNINSTKSIMDLEKEVLNLKLDNKLLRQGLKDVMKIIFNLQKQIQSQQVEIDTIKENDKHCSDGKLNCTKDSMTLFSGIDKLHEYDFDVGELETLPPFPL